MRFSGPTLLAATGIYIAAIVVIAVFASMRERRVIGVHHDPREEHELGGRSLGFWVLLGTLYATQYSGNSFVGFTGKAARDGYAFLGSALFMQSVIVGYLLFAPRLFTLSRAHGFRTPGDFFLHRFEHRGLHLLTSSIMLFALLNFVLSQLVAIGKITLVLGTDVAGRSVHPAWGIVSLAVLMALYENLGGMRAVAWTDLLQGLMLFVAVAGLFVLIEVEMGGFGAALTALRAHWPDKVLAPDARGLCDWVGSTVLFAAGAAVYPHAIQRIYAARSSLELRRSMAVMAFMPLLTTLPLFLIGVFAQSRAGSVAIGGDRAMPFVLDLISETPHGAVLALLVLGGAVSAMMSTADSALLTTSSIVNRDFLERYLLPDREPAFYVGVARACSWTVVLVLAGVATWSVAKGFTIWQILSIKLELLMQIAPALWIGLRTRRLTGGWAFAGVAVGSVVTLAGWILCRHAATGAIAFGAPDGDPSWQSLKAPLGLQIGVWALALNTLICLAGSARGRGPQPGADTPRHE